MPAVIKNAKHASTRRPIRPEMKKGEIILISQNKTIKTKGKKQIQWVMNFVRCYKDEKKIKEIWPDYEGGKYLVEGEDVRRIEPFNINDIKVSTKAYGNMQNQRLEPEDEEIVLNWIAKTNSDRYNEKDQEQTLRALREREELIRNPYLVQEIKQIFKYQCQICNKAIELSKKRFYAEVHHIKPLGPPHNGPDKLENMLCVCPNHHVQFDYGAIRLDRNNIHIDSEHTIDNEYIEYHNNSILGKIAF